MKAEPLTQQDVSYDNLIELQRRLLHGTVSGTIAWTHGADEFYLATPHGAVHVDASRIAIYDNRGVRLRIFAPDDTTLYDAIAARHDAIACDLIDGIIAELDALVASEDAGVREHG